VVGRFVKTIGYDFRRIKFSGLLFCSCARQLKVSKLLVINFAAHFVELSFTQVLTPTKYAFKP
jgi:hypothetical protein